MKRRVKAWLGLVLWGAASLGVAHEIDVMTQNQYFGADLGPVLDAATATPFDADAFSAAVVVALGTIADSRPRARVRALAGEILQRDPDVVALQELYRFDCQPFPGFPSQPGKGCDDPAIRGAFTDHLQDTAAALDGRYRVVGKVTNINVTGLPFVVNGVPALLTMTDRDALLVKGGLDASVVDLATRTGCRRSDDGCNFATEPPPLVLDSPVGPVVVAIERGFLAADLRVRGRDYRVFATHLEERTVGSNAASRLLQVGQAYELLGTVMGTWDGARNAVLLGDINSSPVDTIASPPYPPTLPGTTLPDVPPYQVFASAMSDAWLLRHHQDPGYTCCQAEDLRNLRSQLSERIDMIFVLTARPLHVLEVELIGERVGDKTRPPGHGGLWPSDHAALAARLHLD